MLIDTKFLDKSIEDKLLERLAEKLPERYLTPNIRPELLGVGGRRWYRIIAHDLKELETAVSISNALYISFSRAAENAEIELNRLPGIYK